MITRRFTREELFAEIQSWNQRFPVGTEVRSDVYPDAVYKTRTDAVPLFDQKPVIYLEGFNGYFDLHEIHPVGADGRALDRNGHGTGQERVNGAVAAAQSAANDDPSAATAPSARERVAVVFPGQGAQSKGMGKDLFAAYPEQTDKASEILGYSIRELCVDDPDNRLNQTQYTQPALYVVNALGLRQMQESGAVPADIDVLAGHSLGEYNALLAAGVFDFETGLRLVVERGRLMSQAAGGGMAAVVGLGADALRAALDEAGLQSVDLANFNTPSQIVISGPAADIEAALAALRKQKATVVPLKVSAAFHSRYMQAARDEFAEFLKGFAFNAPQIPVIANATALPYAAEEIVTTLSNQIASPVRWSNSIAALIGQGETRFIEIGSKILTRMITEIKAAAAN